MFDTLIIIKCTAREILQTSSKGIAIYPFKAHNPPPFELICEDVNEWLKADDRNMAVVHRSNGKDRTGTMICAYLLISKLFASTQQFFGEARI